MSHPLGTPSQKQSPFMWFPVWTVRMSKRFLVGGGIALYLGTTYFTYRHFSRSKPSSTENLANPIHTNTDSDSVFNRIASTYDDAIHSDEFWTGILLLRRWLLKKAKGDVLEVSAGTGRNLPYYSSSNCTSLVLTDPSPSMLHCLSQKLQKQSPATHALPPPSSTPTSIVSTQYNRIPTHIQSEDATLLSFHDDQFDCVVDTFGLCSNHNPIAALREMSRVCKKETGLILLLEHGRAANEFWPWYRWLNSLLDQNATAHAEKWGCWWNRPIEDLVHQAGLDIVTLRRFHFGTTVFVVARPKHVLQHQPITTSNHPEVAVATLLHQQV